MSAPTWDRTHCEQRACACHDDSQAPHFCDHCGCCPATPPPRAALPTTAEGRVRAWLKAADDLLSEMQAPDATPAEVLKLSRIAHMYVTATLAELGRP